MTEVIEAALVIGIIMVVLKRTDRRGLERAVYQGIALAIFSSIAFAVFIKLPAGADKTYEGILFCISALSVLAFMVWMHQTAPTAGSAVKNQRNDVLPFPESLKENGQAWGLGALAFLLVFRKGPDMVVALSAVDLTTKAMIDFITMAFALVAIVAFAVLFVRGSLFVALPRFYRIAQWALGLLVSQFAVNSYHRFVDLAAVPFARQTMPVIHSIVRNNTLFLVALALIPGIWLFGGRGSATTEHARSGAEERLAMVRVKKERFYRYAAAGSSLLVLLSLGIAYLLETPKVLPPPETVSQKEDTVIVPLSKLEDGKLHRFGLLLDGYLVRFLAMRTPDGRYHTAVDACAVCGPFGFIKDPKSGNLVCLNCAAEIPPQTLGLPGGCNPVPLVAKIASPWLSVEFADLEKEVHRFSGATQALVLDDPVCGMHVKMTEAGGYETYKKKTYYFCNMPGNRCQKLFKASPEKYAQ